MSLRRHVEVLHLFLAKNADKKEGCMLRFKLHVNLLTATFLFTILKGLALAFVLIVWVYAEVMVYWTSGQFLL